MTRPAADSALRALPANGVSLRNRFLVLFVLIFLCGAIASHLVISRFNRDIVRTLGGWFAEKSVLYEKSQVLQLMLREITLTQKMASSPLLKAWVKAENDPQTRARAIAELEDYRGFFRSRSYFFAIASSGNYYYNDDTGGHDVLSPRYTLSASNPKDGWFFATLEQVPDYQLNVDTDRFLGITQVWINTVLKDNGKPLAVIGTGVDLTDFIKSVISSTRPGVTNILLDRNGAIQAHQDVSIIDFASIAKERRNEHQSTVFNLIDDEADRASFQRALNDLSSGKGDTRSLEMIIQGRRHIAGVTYLPDVRWFLVTLTHPDSAQEQNVVPMMVMALIAGMAVTLLIAGVAFDRVVLRRLAALDAAAREMAAGNYDIRLPQRGRDELTRLAHAFQEMAERVSADTIDLERQVTERTEVLQRLAFADSLTGLLNRRGILDRIEMECNRLTREGGMLGVMILDMDHFKNINDTYGHDLGDRALVRVANTISGVMRSYDVCARWGGEEFLVIVPNVGSREDLAIAAEKLRREVNVASVVVGNREPLFLTVSIGCHLARPSESIDAMLKAADDALYAAKQAGRNRVVFSGESLEG